ncbi:YXWGXW repeat-containing protein [Rhodoferax sp.]|uniref:YXWGXW repeat-containing protein n=1 Tax=Rhodoferax sp. TaxID=50421 RepID=UPI0025F4257E|nr:YXWGXW repeat-containing protein [Rhodoferax sp.]
MSPSFSRTLVWPLGTVAALCVSGCIVAPPPPPPVHIVQRAPAVYVAPMQYAVAAPVVSVFVEPPLVQPAPILVPWAPPPMLVEAPPPMPFNEAVWVGGYWVWEGNWVWAAGHWAPVPQPGYHWVNPYYEHRNDAVVFITGHWNAPGQVFVAPAIGISLGLMAVAIGVLHGPPPMGPQGVFVPPPPGSRPGIIIPAPVGTPPAVVVSAPPVVNVGMHIQNNTTVNNNRTTNITNITNVTIVAPAGATASGRAFESAVPAQAHLAAALPPVVHMQAPVPVSNKPIPSFTPTRAPVALPPPQTVHAVAPPAPAPMQAPMARPALAAPLPVLQAVPPPPQVQPVRPRAPVAAPPEPPAAKEHAHEPPRPEAARPVPPAAANGNANANAEHAAREKEKAEAEKAIHPHEPAHGEHKPEKDKEGEPKKIIE